MADEGFAGMVNALMGRKASEAVPTNNTSSYPNIKPWDTMSQGAEAPFEDIRNDPMARGMDKNSLISIINSVSDDFRNRDVTTNPVRDKALKQLYSSTADEYNNLIKTDKNNNNNFINDWLGGLFKNPPNQMMRDAGYLDVPVALPNHKYFYSAPPGGEEKIPIPRPRPKPGQNPVAATSPSTQSKLSLGDYLKTIQRVP